MQELILKEKEVTDLKFFLSYTKRDEEIAAKFSEALASVNVLNKNIFSYATACGIGSATGEPTIDEIKGYIENCDYFIQLYTKNTSKSTTCVQEYVYSEVYDKKPIIFNDSEFRPEYLGFTGKTSVFLDVNQVSDEVEKWFEKSKINRVLIKELSDKIFKAVSLISDKNESPGNFHRYPFIRAVLKPAICQKIKNDDPSAPNRSSSYKEKHIKIIQNELLILPPNYPNFGKIIENNKPKMLEALKHLGHMANIHFDKDISFNQLVDVWKNKQNERGNSSDASWANNLYEQIYTFFSLQNIRAKDCKFMSAEYSNSQLYMAKVTRKDCDVNGQYEFHIYLIPMES